MAAMPSDAPQRTAPALPSTGPRFSPPPPRRSRSLGSLGVLVHLMQLAFYSFLLFGVCAFGGEPLTVVTKYEDFAAHGLQANVIYYKGKVLMLEVKSVDPVKNLPDWMQAFYVADRDAETAHAKYIFNMAQPNRVGASIGWSETEVNKVLIIGPVLRRGQTFKDTKYLAIAVGDLIAWRGQKK